MHERPPPASTVSIARICGATSFALAPAMALQSIRPPPGTQSPLQVLVRGMHNAFAQSLHSIGAGYMLADELHSADKRAHTWLEACITCRVMQTKVPWPALHCIRTSVATKIEVGAAWRTSCINWRGGRHCRRHMSTCWSRHAMHDLLRVARYARSPGRSKRCVSSVVLPRPPRNDA